MARRVTYTDAEREKIAELELYPDRPGRLGRARRPVPDGWDPVGVVFSGPATSLVYRTPDGELRRGLRRAPRVRFSRLIPASLAPTAVALAGMNGRCHEPTNASWKSYGNRGVRVCSAWRTSKGRSREAFANFLQWVLDQVGRPMLPGEQISRHWDLGDYTPDNCSVVTKAENQRIKRESDRIGRIAAQIIPTGRGRHIVIRRSRFTRMLESGVFDDGA